MCKRWPLYCLGSVCSLCIHLVASIQTSSDVFLLWCALLSHDTDVWADAGGLTSVMRTPSYEWWHPVRALASEGQIDKLFSLKFCINMGSDGSTWEGLIHATTMRGQGVVSKPWVDREVLICWWRGKLLLIMAKLLIGKLLKMVTSWAEMQVMKKQQSHARCCLLCFSPYCWLDVLFHIILATSETLKNNILSSLSWTDMHRIKAVQADKLNKNPTV